MKILPFTHPIKNLLLGLGEDSAVGRNSLAVPTFVIKSGG